MRSLLTCVLTLSFLPLFSQLTFGPEQLISAVDGVVTVYAGDIDGDGDIDLLSTATIDGISWWENDGAGNFTLGQYLQQNGTVPLSKAAALEDFDGDGDLDVMAVINTTTSTSPTDIQYFINNGSGVFTTGFILGFIGANAQEIIAADLDSDGDPDGVFAEGADDQIGWIENLGGGSFGTPEVLFTTSNGAQTVTCADFDQDGDVDIMCAGEYDDEWVWHANDGSENFSGPTLIEMGDNVSSVYHGDLNGDGAPDGMAVYALDGDVVWAPNNNDGTGFATPQFLLDGPGYPTNFPITIEAYDMDLDGDLDPVHCSILDNTISWFDNLGGGSFAAQQILITGASNVRQTAAGDFDGDGDIDLAAANFGANDLVWYENTSAIIASGCTDALACNYDPDAVTDDGSCDYETCAGCTDPTACNYDAEATLEDASCEFGCYGCTDENACNYSPDSTLDDGSCEYITCLGCTDPAACNYDAGAWIDDGLCDYSCYGCTDSLACNYDPEAPADDGTCEYESCAGCTDEFACNYDPDATLSDESCEYITCVGCTDPAACNYDPSATVGDDTCDYCSCIVTEIPGCTNSSAINYQPAADVDDGSCLFPGDVCGVGTLWNSDTGQCEAAENPVCLGDFDGDGQVNTNDLLDFLGFFGNSCE